MSAGVFSFSGPFAILTNSDFSYTLTWKDAAGNPIDLTGYNAKMSFGNSRPPTTIYLTLSSTGESPAITFNALAGQIILYVAQAAISAAFDDYLTNGDLNVVYDLLLYPPEDGVDGFLQGPATVVSGVTTA